MRRRTCILVSGVVAAICLACIMWHHHLRMCEERCRASTYRMLVSVAIIVGNRAFATQPPFALPHGDIRDLCTWLELQALPEALRTAVGNPPNETVSLIADSWGRPVIYRFPSPNERELFQLYSMGPNGLDEGGEGDDVTCGKANYFESFRIYFFDDEKVDPAWVHSNLGKLRRNPATGRIIGVPPEGH